MRPLGAGHQSRTFRRVVIDSRTAAPGDLFVALAGEHHDGHQFIAEALRRGATGVLAREWPRDVPEEARKVVTLVQVENPLAALQALATARRTRLGLKVIGVTGSVGKTSTKEAIAGVLGQRFRVLKSTGNLNTEVGVPLALLDLTEEHQRAVLELAMYDLGEIAALCRIAQPSIGVVTNIGPTHLERLGSMERITDAKAELVESLPPGGTAILNADDPRVAGLGRRTSARCVTYGTSPHADCRAEDIASHGLQGISFRLTWGNDQRRVTAPLLGRHNVYTALAAASVGLVEGLSLEEVAAGLETLDGANRIQLRRTTQGATVLDDTYNASPASMKAALELLAEIPGRRIAVLGDMLELGSYEEAGHREVGRLAAAAVDHLYTIGPRAALIAAAAREHGLASACHLPSKEEAIRALHPQLKEGVVVLVKGSRGMALEELVQQLCRV